MEAEARGIMTTARGSELKKGTGMRCLGRPMRCECVVVVLLILWRSSLTVLGLGFGTLHTQTQFPSRPRLEKRRFLHPSHENEPGRRTANRSRQPQPQSLRINANANTNTNTNANMDPLQTRLTDPQPTQTQTQTIKQQQQQQQQQHEHKDGSGPTWTPQQILYPEFFNGTDSILRNRRNDNINSLPLHAAITKLHHVVTQLQEHWEHTTRHHHDTSNTRDDSWLAQELRNHYLQHGKDEETPMIIRVEQEISHLVDPLGWIHAQRPKYATRALHHNSIINDDSASAELPLLYLADADGKHEAAIYGSALTRTDSILSSSSSSSPTLTEPPLSIWDTVVPYLPSPSRLYGANRFDTATITTPTTAPQPPQTEESEDTTTTTNPWKEWKDGFWVLPSVELRRTQIQQQQQQSDETNSSDTNEPTTSFPTKTVLAVHVVLGPHDTHNNFATLLHHLTSISDLVSSSVASTTLPPVVSRNYNAGRGDSQEVFEKGVTAALQQFEDNKDKNALEKVVLARRLDLHLGGSSDHWCGLDLMRKLKYGGHVGHLFYIHPNALSLTNDSEFFGCTPERLFSISGRHVRSEALAGTRPRGSSPGADAALLQDLMGSHKDRAENVITGKFIRTAFVKLQNSNLLLRNTSFTHSNSTNNTTCTADATDTTLSADQDDPGSGMEMNEENNGAFFVRRLRHLQHICQSVKGKLSEEATVEGVTRQLLQELHPTPAVCGYPGKDALEFIRKYETCSFDRGFYAGPCGYIGKESTDILVAIRSALLTRESASSLSSSSRATVSVYAGAGIVPGSTVEGEWAETSHKLGVVSSLFLPSPLTLQSSSSPNVAWTTAFVEELIRCGVTQFYICPGSRSTPLTAAVARALRMNVGVAQGMSVHDERGAGFRALGYGRGSNRPAAIITSSGTAVANLYPSIVEAGMDGVPLLLLTADRPYENRDTGANQAIDQVKVFSSTYVRWARDISPPNDDVPVSAALSDANHAVTMAKELRGPVHLNIQFRENLAPDSGAIRNDDREGSTTTYNARRFTDVPGFDRWSSGGNQWMKSYYFSNRAEGIYADAVSDLAGLIMKSKRGIIVVGNVRGTACDDKVSEAETASIISHFAQTIGFPIIAGVQNAGLRHDSPAVIPFAEHVLKHPSVSKNLKPDLVIQIGAPLVSSEVPKIIVDATKGRRKVEDSWTPYESCSHILIHPHHPSERHDPDYTVTHRISADAGSFLKTLVHFFDVNRCTLQGGSELTPLVLLGEALQSEMPDIIHTASERIVSSLQHGESIGGVKESEKVPILTEPQITLAMTEVMSELQSPISLFISNSMPVRDAEFFLYPMTVNHQRERKAGGIRSVAVNRGASGIDGIISSAAGYCEATERPTTLLIGDLATLHDINAFHTIARVQASSSHPDGYSSRSQRTPPLTTVIINNDGGGIFSFLPVAKHGNDVGFDDFFGTPTNSFSFEQGAKAFGLPFKSASAYNQFKKVYEGAITSRQPSIIEAQVVGHAANVAVHREISKLAEELIDSWLNPHKVERENNLSLMLPSKVYGATTLPDFSNPAIPGSYQRQGKTLLLLHGWMGDKHEWEEVVMSLLNTLPDDWKIVAIDLPGHGDASIISSERYQSVRGALGMEHLSSFFDNDILESGLSIEHMAGAVLNSVTKDPTIHHLDAICGYSLGGRVALSMSRAFATQTSEINAPLIDADTKLVLLGSDPGMLLDRKHQNVHEGDDSKGMTERISLQIEARKRRMDIDDRLSSKISSTFTHSHLLSPGSRSSVLIWAEFLNKWYDAPLWGSLKMRQPTEYQNMIMKRAKSLSQRGPDIASVLRYASPSRNSNVDWQYINPSNTLFVAGSFDSKYSGIGKQWKETVPELEFIEVPDAGHALLIDAPCAIANIISDFVVSGKSVLSSLPSLEASGNPPAPVTDRVLDLNIVPNTPPFVVKRAKDSGVLSTPLSPSPSMSKLGSLEYEQFGITLLSGDNNNNGVAGIGWGDRAGVDENNRQKERVGFIINIISDDGFLVGVGEVSPLPGLHSETISQAEDQLIQIMNAIKLFSTNSKLIPEVGAGQLLSMDGSLSHYINALADASKITRLHHSVRAGLEMCVLSLASQVYKLPILEALSTNINNGENTSLKRRRFTDLLPLNGLITRESESCSLDDSRPMLANALPIRRKGVITYQSVKVKIGHQDAQGDAQSILCAVEDLFENNPNGKIRADANRAWNTASALKFAFALDRLELSALHLLEFVEEPLEKQYNQQTNEWSIELQVQELETWNKKTGIKYALDESIADLAQLHRGNFDLIASSLKQQLHGDEHASGCAAFVLKPSLLGLELSLRLAAFARNELGIGAVFSSSFDSGVGLAYTAFLGALSDSAYDSTAGTLFSHGLGTFSMLDADTLSPGFASYVNENGMLNVGSLSRALYGLGLDEMRDSKPMKPVAEVDDFTLITPKDVTEYEGVASTSSSGKELSVQVSLPLPFSDEIAHSRFTDLPQQPRWSPWLNSVAYLEAGGETEWTLNIRGVRVSWRAISKVIDKPYKGIMWESVSGLQNSGVVDFIPLSEDSCIMKVKMSIRTPRVIAALFRGTSIFIEDFMRNKLLKWSLEMFRDVVKADLALERGDAELGDALFGAVEGRANAIEATLSYPGERRENS